MEIAPRVEGGNANIKAKLFHAEYDADAGNENPLYFQYINRSKTKVMETTNKKNMFQFQSDGVQCKFLFGKCRTNQEECELWQREVWNTISSE